MLIKNPFEGKKEINIAFIGGSITEGACSSTADSCYFGLCKKWFIDQFKNHKVNCYNAGIGGTGSDFGMVRIEADVISKNPDMVFIEFAVNDGGKDSRCTMESIVRKLLAMKNVPYVVFLYTARNTYDTIIEYHAEVAKYYGIPEINLIEPLKIALDGKNPVEAGCFMDAVHPADRGHKVYADTIIEKLLDDSAYVRPLCKEKMMADTLQISASFTPSTKYEHSSGWEEKRHHRNYECLYSETPGETVSFEFDGNFLGMEFGLHKESGIIEVAVDGKFVKDIGAYYNTVSFQCVYSEISSDLGNGHHNVTLTLKENKSEQHPGTKYMIYHIITGTATK